MTYLEVGAAALDAHHLPAQHLGLGGGTTRHTCVASWYEDRRLSPTTSNGRMHAPSVYVWRRLSTVDERRAAAFAFAESDAAPALELSQHM